MRSPLPSSPDAAALLAWAARVRECADAARQQALTLRALLDASGLTGPAGAALASLGETVAGRVITLEARCGAAADALVREARELAARELAAR